MNVAAAQRALIAEKIDAWLVYDFRHSNAVLARLLPSAKVRHLTRRVALVIPARGTARLLVSPLDAGQFAGVGCEVVAYLGWREFHARLGEALRGRARVAMEYAPGGALPVVSVVDAGIVELVRSMGVEVVTSADLIQATAAAWPPGSLARHREASAKVNAIKDAAFDLIRARTRAAGVGGPPLHEHEVAAFITGAFDRQGLQYPDPPIVATTVHSADPHYGPSADRPTPIQPGHLVMIDLWARLPGDENIHSDVTWMGVVIGPDEPGPRLAPRVAVFREVFDVVRRARDAALGAARSAWMAQRAIHGWELDDAARAMIIAASLERGIKHRTGHSLSPGAMVHGLGMNLDNMETHDTRRMIAGTGFTIEPGVYIADDPRYGFGVRSEVNVYVDAGEGPVVTSGVQDELIRCG